ncbi:catabolite control protein A [Clostridium pasteurianum DSM 525 = ATCC 6013]|uniref:Catabolite control protein A n=1 Tax=Clostridium pasteurianum DSM 525 = ATCC 6013 TaxID=1262449 RepID=A0A0H3J7T8_CLOPA|nr:LacI family DNA-binding transcriptional regulator [Clostridium pasteurianum]AJA49262.1 catabolite control protein A [Clostridium pasteurianum DSM 525 = ATCC 6013]AJA53250.1 catabolite control protein A [Clostridium pasteurianum DSM 525 = ATCC 6013]AOZ76440.1 LacI family transcriptional regulator [Clostridium pasteurianum DSM 525 = ATCC 6013]AOZ80237.1 LacI family transcriptional regulator [Clostridium pasteurianum]ELP58282.1 alanine racemase [Clostridium pasteurianum DSM 525 = ATCC 6013]
MKFTVKNPTIKDVAKQSEVSVATVSRILNDLGGYSEDTRKRVIQVIDEIGYRRNDIARNLKIKSSNTIAVLMPKVGTNFYTEILNGIQDSAHNSGYSVIICNVGDNGDRTEEYIKIMIERQVDGIIVCSLPPEKSLIENIVRVNIPVVLISTMYSGYSIPYIKVDDYKASYAAVEYLIKMGHRDIAMLGGNPLDPIAGIPRLQAFIDALRNNKLKVKENLIKHNGFSFKDGITSMEQLLKEKEKFTAIFASCDEIAIGAISVAHKTGLKIPEDISIIGYDGTQIGEMCYPPLTTLVQPFYDMGEKAVKILEKKISSSDNVESLIMPFKIAERNTVKSIV